MSRAEIALQALLAGAEFAARSFEIFNKRLANGGPPDSIHVVTCLVQSRWAYFDFRRHRKPGPDDMERIPAKLYVGLHERSNGVRLGDFRDVMVPRYFQRRLQQINNDREKADREQASLVEKIELIRNKVYVSRSFPAHLRLIIFERDGYRCQACLRDKPTLEKVGRHLEVDHIKAFIDGGKTTYSNGVTLCDQCNKGKHHMKDYQHAIYKLQDVSHSSS
jgi:5-methylcytosine-specific restriction endonuclease McrA